MLEEAVGILKLVNRRALVGDELLAIDQEFVLLGFAAKDGMVLEDQERVPAGVCRVKNRAAASPLIPPPMTTQS